MTGPITVILPDEPGYLTPAANGYESAPGLAWHSGGFASSNCPTGLEDHPIIDPHLTPLEQCDLDTYRCLAELEVKK